MLGSSRPASSAWGIAVALAIAFALVAVALDRLGGARRVIGAAAPVGSTGVDVVSASTAAETIAAWRSRGLRGRRVLHFGRFLHFEAADPAIAERILTGPGSGRQLDEVLAQRAGPRDYLWVAASLGIARRIDFVSPPASTDARLAALGLDRGALPLAATDDFPRALHLRVPRIEEPVVLSVNASWFEEETGAALLAALRDAGARADLVTVTVASDADDVPEAARERARRFAAELRAGKGAR